ncbi:regulator [bacterium]|nr:regulator [bacterium]
MWRRNSTLGIALVVCFACSALADETSLPGEPYIYTEWETFYAEENGLPNDHIFSLKADGDRLWVGTENGLACYEDGQWKTWTEEDGLPWRVVSGITVSQKTGDVWLGLFGGGVARFSAGRFDHFHQLNSGLVNDVVYGVTMVGDELWAATTAGTSRYNTVSGEWEIYTEKNAPMEEIWCYNIDSDPANKMIYIAVWGGGILEYDIKTGQWTDHHDPDGEMEIDLYRDDGLIHIITTSVSFSQGVMWASTYFGLSRYDGRHWRGYMDHDSGLRSNFINFAKGRGANACYNCTDKGFSVLADFESDVWVSYFKENEEAQQWTAKVQIGAEEIKTQPVNLDLPNHFSIVCEFQGDDVWLGTGHGLACGRGAGYWPGLKKKTALVLPDNARGGVQP